MLAFRAWPAAAGEAGESGVSEGCCKSLITSREFSGRMQKNWQKEKQNSLKNTSLSLQARERAILGILRLIGCHAAVRLGDKRVGDAARHIAPSSAGGVVGQQDHDADDRDVPLRTEHLQDSHNNSSLTLTWQTYLFLVKSGCRSWSLGMKNCLTSELWVTAASHFSSLSQ